jgi:general secretion pathway protein F/type IV pilus assembly protein PilC
MLYKYSGIDSNGKRVSSKIEAVSLSIAKSKLKSQKIIFKSIKEIDATPSIKLSWSSKKRIKPLELSNLSKDIATFLNAGVSLSQTIKMLSTQYSKNKRVSEFFSSIDTFLNEGKTFYQSLSEQSNFIMPDFYMQSIKVSEDSGLLATVLLELSIFLKEQDKISKQVSSALTYPLFLLTVSTLMIGALLSFVVPSIVGVFASSNQELPAVTKFVISFSDFVSSNYHIILGSFVTIAFVILLSYKKYYSFKKFIDKALLYTPFVGKMIEANNLSRFSYITSLLISSGVTLAQAIKLSSNTLTNSILKEAFLQGAKKVVEGERLSVVLQEQSYSIDYSFIQSLSLGEETSQVHNMLTNLAQMYKEKNSDKITTILSLLEPIMMLFVGGFVGFVVVAMLLPIFSMNVG